MEEKIKIHVFHTGEVCVSPYLPFGGDNCSIFQASGLTTSKKNRLWLPVSAYLIEHPKHGKILVDAGWHRDMSPNGVFDKKAQIESLGSKLLYFTNQGRIASGSAIDEQLRDMGIAPKDLDYVILTHLDCDHANGLKLVAEAKNILVSQAEVEFAMKATTTNRIRYQSKWWNGVSISKFGWNDEEGPFARAYDVFGDGSVKCINIPGHSDGLCAVKIRNSEGKFVILASDGGYATKSWKEMITSGIAADKHQQKESLAWLKEQSEEENCVAIFANHDPDVDPGMISL